jgi:hypothetical protein
MGTSPTEPDASPQGRTRTGGADKIASGLRHLRRQTPRTHLLGTSGGQAVSGSNSVVPTSVYAGRRPSSQMWEGGLRRVPGRGRSVIARPPLGIGTHERSARDRSRVERPEQVAQPAREVAMWSQPTRCPRLGPRRIHPRTRLRQNRRRHPFQHRNRVHGPHRPSHLTHPSPAPGSRSGS